MEEVGYQTHREASTGPRSFERGEPVFLKPATGFVDGFNGAALV